MGKQTVLSLIVSAIVFGYGFAAHAPGVARVSAQVTGDYAPVNV
jgi:hypothetical protein